MNSAADLKRLHEQTALQKAKEKVIDALKNDPLGLSANQLMTVCRLSIKTVKNILATIDVQEEHGVYFLSGVARAEISTEPQAEQVTTFSRIGGVMDIEKLEPVEIIRSEMGTWTHPVYSSYVSKILDGKEYVSRDEWDQLKNHFNIETVTYWMEGHVNPDDWEIMMDDCDITKWDPIAPNGFFLIDINFSEDDAYAIFARNKYESEVA